jgi:hypothetical protein
MLKRDAQGDGYKYMTLDKLIDATRPILTKHGLVLSQWPSMVERGDSFVPALVTVLTHAGSADSMEFTCPLYVADKTMQGLGAAITYARRYAWASALGIAAEEDTDAKDEIPF